MRIGICDDNQQILEEMDAVIQEWAAQTNRSDIMVNRFDAAEKLLFQIDGGQSFDAFFLDLRLPKMNGFVLGEIIREKDESVPIVFVTNSDDYLLRGYELQVIRYLKKPIQKEQVFQVMEIISKKHMEKENTFRMIRKDRMTEKLYYRDIRYVVSGIHSVKYAKTNGEMLKEGLPFSFESFAESFPGTFLRCHRGYLVNLQYVYAYSRNLIRMDDGTEIPIGRYYQENTWKKLHKWFMDEERPALS